MLFQMVQGRYIVSLNSDLTKNDSTKICVQNYECPGGWLKTQHTICQSLKSIQDVSTSCKSLSYFKTCGVGGHILLLASWNITSYVYVSKQIEWLNQNMCTRLWVPRWLAEDSTHYLSFSQVTVGNFCCFQTNHE